MDKWEILKEKVAAQYKWLWDSGEQKSALEVKRILYSMSFLEMKEDLQEIEKKREAVDGLSMLMEIHDSLEVKETTGETAAKSEDDEKRGKGS